MLWKPRSTSDDSGSKRKLVVDCPEFEAADLEGCEAAEIIGVETARYLLTARTVVWIQDNMIRPMLVAGKSDDEIRETVATEAIERLKTKRSMKVARVPTVTVSVDKSGKVDMKKFQELNPGVKIIQQ